MIIKLKIGTSAYLSFEHQTNVLSKSKHLHQQSTSSGNRPISHLRFLSTPYI